MHLGHAQPPTCLVLLLFVAAALAPSAALAYVGPGAGLTAIGTVVALLAALVFAVVGFVWYPVKRLLKRGGAKAPEAERRTASK
jgi:hypothetical protein